MRTRQIVLIGAGQASASTALTLRDGGYDGALILVGDEDKLPYERPPLSKGFLLEEGRQGPAPILEADWFDSVDVTVVPDDRAQRILPRDAAVELESGRLIPATSVVVATGAEPIRPAFAKAVDRCDRVGVLRTASDAVHLRHLLQTSSSLGIIGAGFIGGEVASTATALGIDVTLYDSELEPLSGVVGPAAARAVLDMHRARGVTLELGLAVAALEPDRDGVRIRTMLGQEQRFDAVLVCVGVRPRVEVGMRSGASVENGIRVDADGQTSIPNVYAAGDVASYPDHFLGTQHRVEHQESAVLQGALVAKHLMGEPTPRRVPPWFWSDQHGQSLQFTGYFRRNIETIERPLPGGEGKVYLYLVDKRMFGAFGIGAGSSVRMIRRIIGKDVGEFESPLRDPSIDLRTLVRQVIDHQPVEVPPPGG